MLSLMSNASGHQPQVDASAYLGYSKMERSCWASIQWLACSYPSNVQSLLFHYFLFVTYIRSDVEIMLATTFGPEGIVSTCSMAEANHDRVAFPRSTL